MRLILNVILLLLAVLAAGVISRYLATVLAFGVALGVFLLAFGAGVFMVILGSSDESLSLQIIGGLVALSAVFGARRLWTRPRLDSGRRS